MCYCYGEGRINEYEGRLTVTARERNKVMRGDLLLQ